MSTSSYNNSPPIRALVINKDHEELGYIIKVLQSTERIEICGETTSYTLALSQVERSKPEFIFCGINDNPQEALAFVQKAKEKQPDISVVCIGLEEDPQLILQCFRFGADEYLVQPLQKSSLIETFSRLDAQRPVVSPPAQYQKSGKVIAIWGSRGGCGTTTIAANLAHSLSLSKETCLMDLHEAQGDMALFFDQEPDYSLKDIWGRGDRIDESLVDSVTIKHESGLNLLFQPAERSYMQWDDNEFQKVMNILLAKYDFIIQDIGRDEETICQVLSSINEIYLVVNQVIPSIYLAAKKIRWLEDIGFDLSCVTILVNSFNPGSVVNRSQIEKSLGISNWQTIRHDERTVLSAINQGVPVRSISKWSKVSKDISRMAQQVLKAPESNKQQVMAQEVQSLPSLLPNNACT